MEGTGYAAKLKQSGDVELYPQEECYSRIPHITWEDARKTKFQRGTVQITTHRVLFVKEGAALHVPLYNVQNFSKGGGMFHSHNVKLSLCNQGRNPPYVEDLFKNVLKQETPKAQSIPAEVTIKFKEGKQNRDLFTQ